MAEQGSPLKKTVKDVHKLHRMLSEQEERLEDAHFKLEDSAYRIGHFRGRLYGAVELALRSGSMDEFLEAVGSPAPSHARHDERRLCPSCQEIAFVAKAIEAGMRELEFVSMGYYWKPEDDPDWVPFPDDEDDAPDIV
jgi:hypothetical protein